MEKSFFINGTEIKVQDFKKSGQSVSFVLGGKPYTFTLIAQNGTELMVEDGSRFKAAIGSANKDGESVVMAKGREAVVFSGNKKNKRSAGQSGSLTSPMPGKIFKVIKEVGAEVKKGETILILEAMKMEHSIRSDKDGTVKKINYKIGELVQGGVALAEVE